MINIEEMVVPLNGDNPVGENLKYDPLYLEMDSLAKFRPQACIGNVV
ncbi:MAG: type VI secretion system ImpA family N-terminal domain-containing protein [Treponema sp.]|jgi:hypothetical protein|nr:type VI secretion system ImpA family N-terminal domain-containing protein [Treponema sp.]